MNIKVLISALVLSLLSITSFAQEVEKDDFKEDFFKKNISIGVGMEFNTGYNAESHPMIVAKTYALVVGDKYVGSNILGIGVAVDTEGKTSVVFSPICYRIWQGCLGPELLFPSTKETNAGVTLSVGF